jgi:hypothetical protein
MPNNALIIVVDRLHAGFIGAYGNSWIATPELNRLAADGFLCERAMIDSPRLELLYQSYWQGVHALAHDPVERSAFSLEPSGLAADLNAAGYNSVLLSDDPTLDEHPLAAGFGEFELLEMPAAGPDDLTADTIDDTQLARFFAVAAERFAELESPFVCWLHVGSLGRTWDAPREFRDQYADEDDPPLPDAADVPNMFLPLDADPDLLLGFTHSYAGQVSLLDACVGSLLDSFVGHPAAANTLVALIGARGFPLGEHGRVGPCDNALYGELTHVPFLLKLPDGVGASDRTQALVQPADFYATLAEWCGLPAPPQHSIASGRSLLPLIRLEADKLRDRAVAAAGDERALTTEHWSMRCSPADEASSEPRCELFAKPDDRFEVNEVADRCTDEVAQLQQALADFEQACRDGADSVAPLPESLVREWA